MLFANKFSPRVAHAYKCDAWSAILGCVMTGMTLPFVGVIARMLKASNFELGFLTSATMEASLLAVVWANIMEGRRKMPFCTVPWYAARILRMFVIFAHTAHVFVAIMGLSLLIESIAGLAYPAVMKEIYPNNLVGQIKGYVRSLATVVSLVFTLFGGKLLDKVSYVYVFPVAAAVGILSAFIFGRIPTTEITGEPGIPFGRFLSNSTSILQRDKGYLWFCASMFALGSATLISLPIITSYQVDVLHVKYFWASLYAAVLAAVAVPAFLFWGHFIDRNPTEKVVAICACIACAGTVSFAFMTKRWMIIPAAALLGVSNAGISLAGLTGVLRFAPREKVTQYQSLLTILTGLSGLLAPFVGGLLIKLRVMGPRGVFVLAATIMVIAVLVQVTGMKNYKPLPEARS